MDDLVLNADYALTIKPIYLISLISALALIFLFPLTKDFGSPKEKSQYYYLQGITFVGAMFGAKLAVLMGDAMWPLKSFDQWFQLLYTGRSIVGALLFGFLFAESAKPLMGYTRLPNDRFAIVLPFSIALGRIGCWFSGCCLGHESSSALAIAHPDGIQRFPIAFIEISFHVSIGLLMIHWFRQQRFKGQIFALFMISYGSFRFLSEFIRATEKVFAGYSAYQWFSLLLVVAGVISFIARIPKQRRKESYG